HAGAATGEGHGALVGATQFPVARGRCRDACPRGPHQGIAMKTRYFVFALIAAAVIGAVAYGAYRAGMSHGMHSSIGATVPATQSTTGAQKQGDVDPVTGRKVLYWHDPMVPGQKFDKPGKSPFMVIQLVPVYADGGSASDAGTVIISSRVQQNLGVRVAEVKSGSQTSTMEAVGSV